ncbi:GRIK1 [Bugula neritina]|uniref:GRIK1 n=1 Tax=Bugula neritina TaxID=10212 RepID=A0A7J7JC77_BUGNE|nr:GRIK1 [Bugula neritina]
MAMLTEILTYDLMDGEEVIVKGVRGSKEAVEWLNMYSRYKNVLVDLPLTDIVDFVQQAHGMGFLSGYYHFHFTSLDMSLIAEEIGPLTKGAVNVTSFSLIDFDGKAYKSMSVNWHLKYKHADINLMKSTKNALIYDGVAYVSKVVANVVSQTPGYQSTPLSCDGTKEIKPWSSGDSLYQQLIVRI